MLAELVMVALQNELEKTVRKALLSPLPTVKF
jgi:hypothetical protein